MEADEASSVLSPSKLLPYCPHLSHQNFYHIVLVEALFWLRPPHPPTAVKSSLVTGTISQQHSNPPHCFQTSTAPPSQHGTPKPWGSQFHVWQCSLPTRALSSWWGSPSPPTMSIGDMQKVCVSKHPPTYTLPDTGAILLIMNHHREPNVKPLIGLKRVLWTAYVTHFENNVWYNERGLKGKMSHKFS